MDADVFFSLLLTPPADEQAFGGRLVQDLDEHTPEWAPGRWGFGEPFERADREQMLKVWHGGIMWEGATSAAVLGSFHTGRRLPYAQVNVASRLGLVEGGRAADLLQAVAADGGVYGFVHRLLPADLATSDPRSASIAHLGASMRAVERRLAEVGLPNLWWANILGPPLEALLGRERIASAPAYSVRELAEGVWYVQLTDSILDNETEPEAFERSRQAVKAHLGADAFYDPKRGPDARTRTIRLPDPPPRSPRPKAQPLRGFGPPGYLNASDVKDLWEPWASGTRQPDVWDLVDLPADALVALVGVLPDEQLDAEVNQIPPIRVLAQIAHEAPGARFSGRLVGPASGGTESISIEEVTVPPGTNSPTLDQAAAVADRDKHDEDGRRRVTWS